MLSVHERQELARIEADLAEQQPDLARMLAAFDRWAPPRGHRARPRLLVWMPVVGMVALVLALALHNAAVLLIAVLLLALSVFEPAVLRVLELARRRAHRASARPVDPARR